jgi:hypothetical protein
LAAAERLSGADGEATRLATEIAEKLDEQR